MPSALPNGKVCRPKKVGMDGPVISASSMPTFFPWRAAAIARSEVTELFPHSSLAASDGVDLLDLFLIAFRWQCHKKGSPLCRIMDAAVYCTPDLH